MEGIDFGIAIVGANVAALHVLARLSSEQLKETVVIDTSGEWLVGFRERHSALQTQCLRSPVTWSPHPSPTAMQAFSDSHERSKEIVRKVSNATPLPAPMLFSDLCEQSIINTRQLAMQRQVLKDTVLGISPVEGSAGHMQLQLASGTIVTAGAVVYAVADRELKRPEWWDPAVASSNGSDHTRGTLQMSNEVILPDLDLAGKHVAVLGGGMTAAQLAVGALKRGAHHVTLISRRPLRRREQPCKPEWYGNKRLHDYRQLRSAEQRLMLCKEARDGASLNTLLWRQLQLHLKAGTLDIQQSKDVNAVRREDTNEQWELHLIEAGGKALHSSILSVDKVWCAYGCKRGLSFSPLLSKLQGVQRVRVAGDMPVLHYSRLQWPGLPVYVIGPLSALCVGPGAADMPGMRWAADRIIAAINSPEESAECEALQPHEGGEENQPADLSFGLSVENSKVVRDKQEGSGTPSQPDMEAKYDYLSDEQLQLPRQLINNYSWLDTPTSLRIICTLPDAIAKVQVQVEERSVSILAANCTQVFVLQVPKLYGRVTPRRRTVQIKGCKLSVRLYKATEATWALLKA